MDKWKQSLDQAEATLRIRTLSDSVLTDLRNQVVAAQAGARKLTGVLVPPLEAAIARGAQFAPAHQTAASQSNEFKLEYAKLLPAIAARQNLVQQVKLSKVRGQQLLNTLSARFERFSPIPCFSAPPV